ncbi:MAG: hypothetical protein KF785_16680 [Gemmatimonadales bacterium]|nr:hypothetical protein [Gemmatimonadales bacterium]
MLESFAIAPAASRPLWVIGAIAGFLVLLVLVFLYVASASRRTQFTLGDEGLTISRTLYGRTIPWSALATDSARMVNLSEERELQPTMRTNGVGLPGYLTGWFRLRAGGRGLLFVTDRSRVVVVPTQNGFTLLLSVDDPEAFLAALRRGA